MVIPRTVEICILDDLDSFGPPFERYFFGRVKWVPYFGPPPRGPASLNHRDPLIESFYMSQRTSLPILALYSGFEASNLILTSYFIRLGAIKERSKKQQIQFL